MNALLIVLFCFQQPSALESVEREVAAVVEKASKSVVLVKATYTAEVNQTRGAAETLKLSGIIFSADGIILSDGNALDGAREISVVLPDGRELPAQVLAIDKRTSIGVLRIKAEKLAAAEFAAPADIRQGIYAIAVGNPVGLKNSVSVGFVSGLGRSIQVTGRRYDELIQMTTSVQPGDCGGLVANSKGQVIGMVHSSHPGETIDPGSLGILRLFGKDASDVSRPSGAAFATPSGALKFVAERVVKFGHMVRGYAGISVRPIDDETRAKQQVPEGQGGEIFAIEKNGPARRAGLKRGDILLSFDGAPVSDLRALRRKVMEFDAARAVKVAFLRGGERHEIDLTVEVEPQP